MISTKKKIIIEWVEYDDAYMAYCPELGKYSCNGMGPTIEDALEKLQRCIDVIEKMH